jgi:hypothetical protein
LRGSFLIGAAVVAVVGVHAPAFAQSDLGDAKILSTCISKVGQANAARPHLEGGCVGLIRTPCMPEVPNTAESITCLSREDAAWVRLTDEAMAKAKSTLKARDFTKLQRRREAWIKTLAETCKPEEVGSLAMVESEFCEQEEIAKLAVDVLLRVNE